MSYTVRGKAKMAKRRRVARYTQYETVLAVTLTTRPGVTGAAFKGAQDYLLRGIGRVAGIVGWICVVEIKEGKPHLQMAVEIESEDWEGDVAMYLLRRWMVASRKFGMGAEMSGQEAPVADNPTGWLRYILKAETKPLVWCDGYKGHMMRNSKDFWL